MLGQLGVGAGGGGGEEGRGVGGGGGGGGVCARQGLSRKNKETIGDVDKGKKRPGAGQAKMTAQQAGTGIVNREKANRDRLKPYSSISEREIRVNIKQDGTLQEGRHRTK